MQVAIYKVAKCDLWLIYILSTMASRIFSVNAVIVLFIFSIIGVCQGCTTNKTLNCTGRNSKLKCNEVASCLKMHWSEMAPYAYYYEQDLTKEYGILIGVARVLLRRCCRECWSINMTEPVNFTDFYETEPKDAGLSLPYVMSAADYYAHKEYVPVIKDPSSAYVKKKEGWKTMMKNLFSTLWDAWPVLITALLFSWISGMIIWVIEMWWNDEQFPKVFLRGSWEGFWWAFVSMTTVGYGDRAPRTFPGRVFAICWIMIGICICSIFTATLTSALTMNSFENHKTITRKKVGVLANSMEAITAIQNQADILYYNSSGEVWDAVVDGYVDGILLDYYYALVYEEALRRNDLMIANVFKPQDWSIGINLKSEKLAYCMREEYNHDYARILYNAIAEEGIPEPSKTASASQISGIFDPNGAIFRWILIGSTLGACCMFIVGICWDFVCRAKKIGCKSERKFDNVEEQLLSELQSVFMNWKERRTMESFDLRLESKA